MNREDQEGIRRVEALLRQQHEHHQQQLDRIERRITENYKDQKAWNEKFEQRQLDLERTMATRAGIAKAIGWLIAAFGTIGGIAAALVQPWKF